MKKLENLPLLFIGDNHGNYDHLFSLIKRHALENCYLFHVGDGGEGFLKTAKQYRQFNQLNDFFKGRNIQYKSIRGNHSDPFYFTGTSRFIETHFELIEDYTVLEYKDKKIQLIGGATSLDRIDRTEGVSYWKGETLVLDESKCQKVDILVTHTAPMWCFPQGFNDTVLYWASRDRALTADLLKERQQMNTILNICKPSLHLYGHFHASHTELVNGCKHKLLNIDEIWEYSDDLIS